MIHHHRFRGRCRAAAGSAGVAAAAAVAIGAGAREPTGAAEAEVPAIIGKGADEAMAAGIPAAKNCGSDKGCMPCELICPASIFGT